MWPAHCRPNRIKERRQVTQGRLRASRSRLDRHHLGHVFACDARHAGGGRREDRRGTKEGVGVIGAALAGTSRRELEALLLDEPHAGRDDVGVELDPGVRADLG